MKTKQEPKTGYDDEKTRDISRLSKIGIKALFAVNKILLDAEDELEEENDEDGSENRL